MMIPIIIAETKEHLFINDAAIKFVRTITPEIQEIECMDGEKVEVQTILQTQTVQVPKKSGILMPMGPAGRS